MDERIHVAQEQGVADVRLVRGDKMNALDDQMFEALRQTGERLKATPGLRASRRRARAPPAARCAWRRRSSGRSSFRRRRAPGPAPRSAPGCRAPTLHR